MNFKFKKIVKVKFLNIEIEVECCYNKLGDKKENFKKIVRKRYIIERKYKYCILKYDINLSNVEKMNNILLFVL